VREPRPPESIGQLIEPLTSFVGRRREIADVQRLLETTRLLTITGAGGAGKTRLALHVASALSDDYVDGVSLVALESIADAALVSRHVATELGVREEPEHQLDDTLIAYLHQRQTLLVLDNCEHLAAECAALSERLLRACPGLRILATSRQPLGIGGELTWRIPSLTVPDAARTPVERLRQVESVQLFAERAAAVMPGFTVTEHNARGVAEVCQRLDGMPLALELAAVRVRAFGVEQIAARLSDRFRLLTGGSPTVLPRQQTLLGTLDWSYELLSEMERRLMRRVAVFAGGWTLEGAELVCAGDRVAASDVLELLAQLVDKSLVVADLQVDGAMRYRLLESIREYAADKLRAAGEESGLRKRHATWILSHVDSMGPGTIGPQQAVVLQRLLPELDNLRTALDFAAEDQSVTEAALRACVAAYRLWLVCGFLSEGRRQLVRAARAATTLLVEPWRANALFGASTLAMFQGDFAAARGLVEESLAIARDTGNSFQVGESLSVLALLLLNQGESTQAWGVVQEGLRLCRRRIAEAENADGPSGNVLAHYLYGQGWPVFSLGRMLFIAGVLARVRANSARALEFFEEALDCLRQQGDVWFIGQVLSNLGLVAVDLGEPDRARQLFEEALALRRALGDRTGIARSLNDLGRLAYAAGDLESAQAAYAEQLVIVRDLGDRSGIADALVALGQVARQRGDLHAARGFFAESLSIRRELGHRLTLPTMINDLAELAAAEGDAVRAIRLAGAAAALRETIGSSTAQFGDRGPERAYALLAAAEAAAAWEAGRSMNEAEVMQYALAKPTIAAQGAQGLRDARRPAHAPLSARELSVARLIAFGRTNRQIASELIIAEGTADRHVSNILSKLGLGSRAQVAVWLVERGLLPRASSGH
jgi:predicted ATPase/DNA-binding CsgD family transcriptional regulator